MEKNMFKLKTFISLLFISCLVLLSACSEPEQTSSTTASTKTYRLKLAETWGPNFPIFGDASKDMAAMVEKMSGGRLTIQIDSSNKHKAPFGIFDMVKTGQYDMGHSASYYWKGKIPATMFFTTMPFSMVASEQFAWFYYGGGLELMNELYAPHNLLSFPGGNTGNQMAGWFQKEINSLEDLKGLKIRIPGFAGEVLAELGAKPTNIPPGELYTALERGTVDAVEWVGPSLDLRMGFHKIAPYYYTGWHEPAAELQFLVNKKTFESLPEDLQEILRVAMKASAYDMYAHSTHASGENWASMSTEFPNIKVKTFPKDVLDAMKDANKRLVDQSAAADPFAAKVLNSQQAYLAKVRQWTKMSDLAYLNSTDETK
ncbi:MAG: TRAP-type mannitol/chloroaromatic compound transport system substrate-binding protein [Oleiphilaceae bacterium]|jgi:TRAP-type mannitol/chloroaromatic compound transport system substrate-binding protein